MPRKPPAEPIDHHYNIPRLNRAFWWTGLTLTVVFVVMIIADYTRDWKTIQRTFMRLDAKLTREAALAARSKALDEEHGKLIGELKAARVEVAAQGAAARKLQARLQDLDPKVYLADQQYKFTKASFDAVRYQYEDALANTPKTAPKVKRSLDAIVKELDERTVHLADLKKQQADTQKELDAINAKKSEIETTIEKKTAAFRLVRTKYAGMKQDTLFELRNSPILDMINPSLRINQVQLPDQFINVNFMKIPKVDRCTTCHVAADRKGFEDPKIKTVFRTHPSFHKMVGSESMHPATTFGCTPCHGGRDRATSFWSAGHSPTSEAQEKAWTKKYDWEFDKFNENPVLPLKYAEAGCYRCHTHEVNFPDAPTLDAGMRMVESLGCWGCHRIDGLDKQHLPKVGPSLEKVASKVSKEWTTRWVMNPPSFRANTRMPNFFYLENFVNVSGPKTPTAAQAKMDEDGRIENNTMINAIVSYIYDKSRPADVPAVAGKGDATRGAKLLAERGCFGCHVADPTAQRDLVGTYRQFGPNLSGVGSKASRDWIYHWILNPKEWNPDTKMPNLRLTNEDALDIAEYLVTLKAPAGFDTAALPKTDEKTLDQIALYFELSNHTLFDAKAELAKMDLHGKEVYAGKNLISHYGCFACHAIPGFEDAKPIGTELTEEGSKAVHRLDFGFIHLPHTRQDWFWQKLHTPRIFDRDRARGWEEKLRMPNFRFSDRELDQMVTTVLGFQQLNAASNVVKELSPREAAIERGRRLVKDHNCQGCHVIEGVGGSFRSVVADTSLAPPIIQGEGAKVQSDWLFSFLAGAEDRADPALARGPHADLRFHGPGAERPDALLRIARPRGVPVPDRRLLDDAGELAGGQESVRALEVRPVPPAFGRRTSTSPASTARASRPTCRWPRRGCATTGSTAGSCGPTNGCRGPGCRRTSRRTTTGTGSPRSGASSISRGSRRTARSSRGCSGGDEAAKQFLSNPEAITKALRDYVWSIGINGGSGSGAR